jgi:rhodanese-related sulfurtransferase
MNPSTNPKVNPKIELSVYIVITIILGILLVNEGQKRVQILSQKPLSAKEAYNKLKHPQTKLQIIDIRADQSAYEDAHVPGAIPLFNCDFANTDEKIKKNIFTYLPTIIVTDSGDQQAFNNCAKNFTQARNLAGGMSGWSDEGLPEDSSEYTPPKLTGGGGCL